MQEERHEHDRVASSASIPRDWHHFLWCPPFRAREAPFRLCKVVVERHVQHAVWIGSASVVEHVMMIPSRKPPCRPLPSPFLLRSPACAIIVVNRSPSARASWNASDPGAVSATIPGEHCAPGDVVPQLPGPKEALALLWSEGNSASRYQRECGDPGKIKFGVPFAIFPVVHPLLLLKNGTCCNLSANMGSPGIHGAALPNCSTKALDGLVG